MVKRLCVQFSVQQRETEMRDTYREREREREEQKTCCFIFFIYSFSKLFSSLRSKLLTSLFPFLLTSSFEYLLKIRCTAQKFPQYLFIKETLYFPHFERQVSRMYRSKSVVLFFQHVEYFILNCSLLRGTEGSMLEVSPSFLCK